MYHREIDGQRILRDSDYTSLMDGRAGKDLRVSVYNPKNGKRFDVQVRPISREAQRELLYKRWVDHNRELVDSLSHGQLAYVHVKAMDSESFRTVFSELLSDKTATARLPSSMSGTMEEDGSTTISARCSVGRNTRSLSLTANI